MAEQCTAAATSLAQQTALLSAALGGFTLGHPAASPHARPAAIQHLSRAA